MVTTSRAECGYAAKDVQADCGMHTDGPKHPGSCTCDMRHLGRSSPTWTWNVPPMCRSPACARARVRQRAPVCPAPAGAPPVGLGAHAHRWALGRQHDHTTQQSLPLLAPLAPPPPRQRRSGRGRGGPAHCCCCRRSSPSHQKNQPPVAHVAMLSCAAGREEMDVGSGKWYWWRCCRWQHAGGDIQTCL